MYIYIFKYVFIQLGAFELHGSVVSCLTLIWENSKSLLSQIFFCSFLSFFFWYYHYLYITPFVVVSQSLIVLFFLFFSVYHLSFTVFEDFIGISSAHRVFPQLPPVSNKPIKGMLHFYYSALYL